MTQQETAATQPAPPDDPADPAAKPAPLQGGQPVAPATLLQLALLFTRIGLTSFGGGLSAWLFREVAVRLRWLSEEEFLGALTMSQILPGSNVINLAIYVGHRMRGGIGSLVATSALLLPPMVVVIFIAMGFQRISDIVWLHNFLEGVAAAAIGMTVSMGLRNARRALRAGRWTLAMIAAVFVAIGLLRWPLVPVALALAVVALVLARNPPPARGPGQ
jgi:chromate transporter